MRKAIALLVIFTLVAMVFALFPMNAAAPAGSGDQYEAYFISKPSASAPWGPYTQLSYTPTDSRFAMTASNDAQQGYIVVVYADNALDQWDWYFTKSTDSGVTWSAPAIAVNPSFDVRIGELYSAAIDMGSDGIVHMIYCRMKDSDTNQPTGVYYTQYDGSTWLTPIVIQESLTPSKLLLYTTDIIVGMNDNTIHLAYGSDYPGHDNGDTWYSKSTDGGFTWSTPVNINQDGAMDVGYTPSLAADSYGNLYVANDGGAPGYIWFKRSPTNGNTWNSHLKLASHPNAHRQPLLMCDDRGGVYQVYMSQNPSDWALMYKYSTNYGSSWMPSQLGGYTLLPSVPGMGFQYLAKLDESGFIHIVYRSTDTGVSEVYYMKINTVGQIISPPVMISPDDGIPSSPTGLSLENQRINVGAVDYVPGEQQEISADIEIHPETLNAKSKGKWVTCIIELPEGYDYMDIDPSTVYLEGDIPAEKPVFTGHSLNVKFNRAELIEKLNPGEETLTVTGELTDGTLFSGTDTITFTGLE